MHRTTLRLLFLGAVLTACARAALWQPLAPLPAGNAGFACAVLGGRLLVAGGTDLTTGVKRAVDAVLAYDEAGNRWLTVGRLPRPYYYGAFAADGKTLLVIGGDDGGGTRADSFALGRSGASRPFAVLPQPIGYTGAVRIGHTCYILGGARDVRHLRRMTDDFFALDFETAALTRLPPFPGGAMFQPCLAAAGARIYSFAGGRYDRSRQAPVAFRESWSFDTGSGRWSPLAPYPFPARALAACALDSDHILVGGGAVVPAVPGGNTACAKAFLYEISRDRYLPLPDFPTAAMLLGLEKTGRAVTLIGGEDGPHHRAAAVYRAPIARLIAAARAP